MADFQKTSVPGFNKDESTGLVAPIGYGEYEAIKAARQKQIEELEQKNAIQQMRRDLDHVLSIIQEIKVSLK